MAKPYRIITIKTANESDAERIAVEYGGTVGRAGLLDSRSKVTIICETEEALVDLRAKVDANVADEVEEG
jgi:hypothetical protein